MPNLQASTIELSNSRKMLNRQPNDTSNFDKSPKIRRKIDFSDREYQPSVIDRARLTLFNLTDIWKSKLDAHKVQKSYDSPVTANRRALDVLTVWAKHSRSPSAEPAHSTKSSKRNAFIENHVNERWRSDGKTYIKIVNAKGNKSRFSSSIPDKSKHKYKSSNNINKNGVDDVPMETSVYLRQRSYDGGINYLNNNGIHDDDGGGEDNRHSNNDTMSYNSTLPKQRQRRRSWGTIMPPEMLVKNRFYANKTYCDDRKRGDKIQTVDNQASVVKARLKFKKIKTCDDMYANEMATKKPIKLLRRQTSVVPIITINDCDSKPSSSSSSTVVDVTVAKKSNTNEQRMDGPPLSTTPSPSPTPSPSNDAVKPRKKLSFREPVIFNEKLRELREKHSTKNPSNSDVQNDDGEKSSSNESMDISQVPPPLEV